MSEEPWRKKDETLKVVSNHRIYIDHVDFYKEFIF
jgi:hypothetical protein